jgi:photosystem II stability/assembly factor-like uncharacterized protein
MVSSTREPANLTAARVLLAFGLGAMMVHAPARAQDQAILYAEDFTDGQAQGWELEPGWIVRDQMLQGEGHSWARPKAGPWQNFRLSFRVNLQQGTIHLVYRLNETGRYFIGFHEHGSYLHKQYWPDTFLLDRADTDVYHPLGRWHQIEIVGQGPSIKLLVDGGMEWEYTDPDPLLAGSFAFETLDDSIAYINDIVVRGSAADTPLSWVRTGGPLGGLGYDVRMRPDNPDMMYVTDAWAGVHLSTDGGRTWSPANEGITTRTGSSGDAIPVFCLTIDPQNHDILWAGTQFTRGIFRSADGGRTWAKMDQGIVESDGISFRGFGVDPHASNVVYAAAEISSWIWNGQPRDGREFDMTQGVVYKTTDSGKTWKAVWRGDNLARYVWIDSRRPDTVYVSTGIFDREAANSVPNSRTPGGVGIIKSTDGGKNWTPVTQGLVNLYVGTLFLHPQNPDILLAGAGNNQYHEGAGVYVSTDGGTSWKQVLSGDIIESVEFALSDPNIAYAGSSNAVYRSVDVGRTWRKVSGGENGWGPPGVRAGFPIDFQVDPRGPNRLFANNYGGGNFLSTDGGRTWTVASQDCTGAQVRDIAVDPTAAGRVVAAGRSGLFASHNGGGEWLGLNYPPAASMEWNAVAVDPRNPQHMLAANNWNNMILQSHDAGHMWRATNTAFGEGVRVGWRVVAFAPSDPMTVYAGSAGFFSAGTFDGSMPGRGIYVSRDGGTIWAEANDDSSRDAHVTSVAIDPGNLQTVYAATSDHGLLKSTNGGQRWTATSQRMGGSQQMLSVAIHPSDSKIVYAGQWQGGLYRSVDGGTTWTSSAAGMNPEATVSDIVFDPTNPQVMYAADVHSGVYRSVNGGATWTAASTGLRMRAVNALAISTDGQHLYAATEGEGVFRLDLNGQPPEPALLPIPAARTAAVQATQHAVQVSALTP